MNLLKLGIALIFGGCCSNVLTFEQLIWKTPNVINIITFTQFAFVALEGYYHHFDRTRPPFFIKERAVPLKKWIICVAMFFVLSWSNNAVVMFNISIPVHIVFRSSGAGITMIVGYLFARKRYNRMQILAATLLAIGACMATYFNRQSTSTGSGSSDLVGICLLVFGSVLGAVFSLYNEKIYKEYGPQWRESLFYTHMLALPIYLVFFPKVLIRELDTLLQYPSELYGLPQKPVMLVVNVLTQAICIRGVNMLASQTDAVTLSVVLLVRKFVSLVLSLYIFGNKMTLLGGFGAGLVFFAAYLYSRVSSAPKESDVLPHVEPVAAAEKNNTAEMRNLHSKEPVLVTKEIKNED